MFNNSTLTAADIQARLRTQRSEAPSDSIVKIAIRHVVDIIDKERWSRNQSETRGRTGVLAITSSGYDLSLITDLGDTVTNFVVFENEVKQANQLVCRDFMSQERGFYVEGSTLYLTNGESASIVITYAKKSPRITDAEELSDYTLPIPQQMEEAVFNYLERTYYDGRFQFELRGDAMSAFLAELSRVLSVRKRVALV